MEQVKTEKAQNRASRETESRQAYQRPTSWRPPETLPQPNPRPGITHQIGRAHV